MALINNNFDNYTRRNSDRIKEIVNDVNSFSIRYRSLGDAEIAAKTEEFRSHIRNGGKMSDIIADALAVCREAIRRKTGMYPYDVQIEAAAAMYDNTIAEMKTGEGKTLVQILSSYLFAIEATSSEDKNEWESVHIMTANEHLASRDHDSNEPVFNLLGLSCGYAEEMTNISNAYKLRKKQAYKCDIVYGTAKTIAFDYLEDNHAKNKNERYITRGLYHAIVDEADSILLDDAVTPLILTGSLNGEDVQMDKELIDLYDWATKYINGEPGSRSKKVTCTHFDQFNRDKTNSFESDAVLFEDIGEVYLSDRLTAEISSKFNMNNINEQIISADRIKAVTTAILAKEYYKEGIQYEVLPSKTAGYKEVVLTDPNTGRSMYKTRMQDGIQEAIEANENYLATKNKKGYRVEMKTTPKILSATTYPDFLSLYKNGVSGMTGTSDIEEFRTIYGLETYEVPTKKKNIRKDLEDELYFTKEAKYDAILQEVLKCKKTLQPILIGTTSRRESDDICKILKENGIRFQRLDTVNRENESSISTTAGLAGMVTVATNMAGRGVDIKLGESVRELGGLYVIGASRNNSKRVDNQLRGRSARQGDPGKSKFFMSLEDDLFVTMCNKSNSKNLISKLNTNGRITNKIMILLANACQPRMEGVHKKQRQVINEIYNKALLNHKKIIFEQRNKIVNSGPADIAQVIKNNITSYVNEIIDSSNNFEIITRFSSYVDIFRIMANSKSKDDLKVNLINSLRQNMKTAITSVSEVSALKKEMLNIVDLYWSSHIDNLESIRKSCLLKAYAGQDFMKVYELDAFNELNSITNEIRGEFIGTALSHRKTVERVKKL